MKHNLKRARQLLLLISCSAAILFAKNAEAQTCASPFTITINGCDTIPVNDSIAWLSFNSGSGAAWCNITMTNDAGPIVSAELYSGTCSSLTLVQTGFQDIGEFVIKSNITASTNYLVKVTRSNQISGQLHVCSSVIAASPPCQPCTSACQLVCNGDLETYVLPDNQQHVANFESNNVCSWGTPGASTPDYFIANPNVDPRVQTTNNYTGSETPHSGNAYGGIYCFYSNQGQYREYIQHHLQTPLVAGQWYTLTFWVSLADYSGHTVNDLGAYISVTQPQQQFPLVLTGPGNTPIVPQVVMNSTTVVPTNGWVPISGTFQATAGMQWITIGSFQNDQTQQHPLANPFPTANNPYYPNPPSNPHLGAYYYIDDISIEIPDPCFTWQGCSPINFYNNSSPCNSLIVSESWDFGDPASGGNNFSTSSNPSHTFTQNYVSYVVTHIIQTTTTSYTCTQTVTPNPPVANIIGYATNNCGGGTMNYASSVCDPNLTYDWAITTNNSTYSASGCTVNVNWGIGGGTITLTVSDPSNDCQSSATLVIPPCCDEHLSSPDIHINNMLASQVIAQYGNPISTTADVYITGVFTVDVPITFQNCSNVNIGSNTPININSGASLTFDHCTTTGKCTYMWDGIYIPDPNTTLNIINGSVIQYARHAVVSNNGGNFFIENSTLQNNDTDVVVNTCQTPHTGIIRNTTFTMSGPMLSALPALPSGHTKTVCAIEIKNNVGITIGDATLPAYQNHFSNIFVGIRSRNSVTTVVNSNFTNMVISLTIPNAGTGIVATGKKGVVYQPVLNVGGTGNQRCYFSDMSIGIDVADPVDLNITGNTIQKVKLFGIRVIKSRQTLMTIDDNIITNSQAPVSPFNTAILFLECYFAHIDITNNKIIQSGSIPYQIGVGIKVSLVTPGDVFLNVTGNTLTRVKTGIWTQRLIGINHVAITSNAVGFFKQNPQYTSLHEGIRIENCATVSVKYNSITKYTGSPNLSVPNNLRGVSIIDSKTNVVAHNTLTKVGAGVYAYGQCGASSFACNAFNTCFNGFFFDGPTGTANIGDQVVDATVTPHPTGNTWSSSLNSDLAGAIFPAITWYRDSYNPSTNPALQTGSLTGLGNTATFSGNSSGCFVFLAPTPSPAPIIDRQQNAGEPVLNPNVYISGTQQSYNGRAQGHRMLRENPSWMLLGSPQDSLYSGFYIFNENSNIGLFRNFEDMAAVDSLQAASNVLTNITDTNISETNLKMVYSIYESTWMQGIEGFSSADSSTLYTIAVQNAADGGEAVYAARVMLGLLVDESGNAARFAEQPINDETQQPISIYPNPANDKVNGVASLADNQTAVLNIVDLQGKTVMSQTITSSGIFTLNISNLESGMYFVQMVVNGELIDTSKLEVIHE